MFVCVRLCLPVFDEVSASLMNTLPAAVRLCQMKEPKERRCAPAEKHRILISLPVFSNAADLPFPPLFSHFLNTSLSFSPSLFYTLLPYPAHSLSLPPLHTRSHAHSIFLLHHL